MRIMHSNVMVDESCNTHTYKCQLMDYIQVDSLYIKHMHKSQTSITNQSFHICNTLNNKNCLKQLILKQKMTRKNTHKRGCHTNHAAYSRNPNSLCLEDPTEPGMTLAN